MTVLQTTDNYRLIETLAPGRSFLCADASGNIVVLIRLEDDCVHRRQLHPSIRDRLARVRELPHPRVATLRSVERCDGLLNGLVCMVWVYLDGENWDEISRQYPDRFGELAGALVSNVATLHDTGIVHGNLHGRNIIVRPDRQVWLTHVSPYLYTDPAVDIAAVLELLRNGSSGLSFDSKRRLSALLDDFDPRHDSLKELSRALAGLDQPESSGAQPTATPVSQKKSPPFRRRSLIGAGILSMLAIGVGVGVNWRLTHHNKPGAAAFGAIKP